MRYGRAMKVTIIILSILAMIGWIVIHSQGKKAYEENKAYIEYASVNGGSYYDSLERAGNEALEGQRLMNLVPTGVVCTFLSAVVLYALAVIVSHSERQTELLAEIQKNTAYGRDMNSRQWNELMKQSAMSDAKRIEVERCMQEQAERQSRLEAEEKARKEAEHHARLEAERLACEAREAAEQKAREEAEQKRKNWDYIRKARIDDSDLKNSNQEFHE